MRGPPRIIRLNIVEPDESVLPAPPCARGLDIQSRPVSLIVAAVRGADGDDHVRRPEIRLEGRARCRLLLRIRPPRLDLGREYPMRVFDEAARRGQRPRVAQSQMVYRQAAERRRRFCWHVPNGRREQIDWSASWGCDGTIR